LLAAGRGFLDMTPQWNDYFSREVAAMQSRGLNEIERLDQWQEQRQGRRDPCILRGTEAKPGSCEAGCMAEDQTKRRVSIGARQNLCA